MMPRCLQAAQEKHLQRDLSPILLCALVNNNARCYNESMDFAEHMNEILPESLKVSLSRPEDNLHGHTVRLEVIPKYYNDRYTSPSFCPSFGLLQ